MNDDKMSIPYIAFEGELARAERHIKRLWIVNIILIIALILCNAAYLWYLSLYDFSSVDYKQSNDNGVNIVGDSNGVDYGLSESEDKETDIEK